MTGLRLAAIVLAAGQGSRFGGQKLTSQWEDGLLIDGAIRAAVAAPVEDVIVVTGADPKVIEAAQAHVDPRVRLTYAQDHARGMSASLKAGINAMRRGMHGVYIFLGDMPAIPHDVLQPLAEAVDNGAPAAAPVFHGRRGHPVIIASALFDMLMELQGDNGAGGLLNALGTQVVTIPTTDEGVVFDVDVR
ncbi:MAG TPA: nucleotidyltransferase family protein [Caulobacteraceae bacterium]|nr:nucleotidyltransferase family protein [Caulobacteraceae bacterium]